MVVHIRPGPGIGAFDQVDSVFADAPVVVENAELRAMMHVELAVEVFQSKNGIELLGEDGEFVGPAVVVGVFANADAVAAVAFGLQFVRIVVRFADPEAAALVPSHVDRFAFELRLRDEEFYFEADGSDKMLHRLFDG